MKAKSVSDSFSVSDPGRCQHRTVTGKRCRLAVVHSNSGLCHRHAAFHSEAATSTNLRSMLAGDITEFEDAHSVNKFLSKLLLLLAEDRVSPRRGATMAYTCNLILRTLTVGMQELRVHGEDEPQRVDVDFGDLPRPDRSQPSHISPEPGRPS